MMTGERRELACSIVIRAYNEAQHIGRLISGICQQTVKDLEVILVDSGSSDATISTAQGAAGKIPFKVVHIQPGEFTFGRSLNLGIAAARAGRIVIASAHVYPVYPDWLEKLLAPMDNPQVALSYGKQRGNSATQFSEQQIFAHWFPDHSQPRQLTPFCNNANAAIQRHLWQEHPYDETLSGLEDLAWARWAMEAGYAISYAAEAEIIHIHHETPRGVYNRYRREAMAFKRIFPNEHFGLGDFFRTVTSNIAHDVLQAARQRVLARSLGSIFWFRWNQFAGTYQGYRHSGPLTWQLRQTFYYPHSPGSAPGKSTRDVEPIQYPDGLEKP